MNPLENAIDRLSDSESSISNGLLSLFVVAHRCGLKDLEAWLKLELNSYPDCEAVPTYRQYSEPRYAIRFHGPGGFSLVHECSTADLPDCLRPPQDTITFRESVVELEKLEATGTDPVIPLSNGWVQRYRQEFAKGQLGGFSGMEPGSATISIPTNFLTGVVGAIRVEALQLALTIEDGDSNNRDTLQKEVALSIENFYGDIQIGASLEARQTNFNLNKSTNSTGHQNSLSQ